jgi:hypothetical protein
MTNSAKDWDRDTNHTWHEELYSNEDDNILVVSQRKKNGAVYLGACSSMNTIMLVQLSREHLDLEQDSMQGFPNEEISTLKITDMELPEMSVKRTLKSGCKVMHVNNTSST